MAFRLNGTVYLAREDGVRAIPLVRTEGVFALSPDARSLAFVDPGMGRLAIVDLSKQTTRTVGPARQVTPRWAPDSSWVLGVRDASHGSEVFRVDRSTGAAAVLGAGSGAAVSPDGSVVAIVPGALARPASSMLALLRDGRPWRKLTAPGPIVDAALGDDTAYVATAGALQEASPEGVWVIPFAGGGRRLSRPEDTGEPGDFGMLALSDNAEYLAFARIGDDGRSRAWIARTRAGAPVQVALRRDVYPLWWASDSSALYAIEGNSWQGESTALVRVAPDGHRDAVVVQGADR